MNANLSHSSPDDDRRWPDLLVANYPLVEEIVRFVARRHRLTPDDANELGSLVRYKLVEDNYHVLRSFQHRSSIRTYLTTVVSRVWLDWQIARRGKWRPSVAAKRLGTTAVHLEQLLFRDRLSFSEACETLRQNAGVDVSETQLDRLRGSLRSRPRPVMCSIEDVDPSQCVAMDEDPASGLFVDDACLETSAVSGDGTVAGDGAAAADAPFRERVDGLEDRTSPGARPESHLPPLGADLSHDESRDRGDAAEGRVSHRGRRDDANERGELARRGRWDLGNGCEQAVLLQVSYRSARFFLGTRRRNVKGSVYHAWAPSRGCARRR